MKNRFSGHPLCYCSLLPDSACDFCSGVRLGTLDDYKELVGRKVYYTGDMANMDGWGRITRVGWDSKWGYRAEIYISETDGDRQWRAIHTSNFIGIGRRFQMETDYQRIRRERIAEFTKEVHHE